MGRTFSLALAFLGSLMAACGGSNSLDDDLIGEWERADGRTDGTEVMVFRGFEHCGTENMVELTVTTDPPVLRRHYLRDPDGAMRRFSELWAGMEPFSELESVPANAVDTGFERDGVRLWLETDHSAAYFEFEDTVEHWPASPQSLTYCD